jgi:hypothetical protein
MENISMDWVIDTFSGAKEREEGSTSNDLSSLIFATAVADSVNGFVTVRIDEPIYAEKAEVEGEYEELDIIGGDNSLDTIFDDEPESNEEVVEEIDEDNDDELFTELVEDVEV